MSNFLDFSQCNSWNKYIDVLIEDLFRSYDFFEILHFFEPFLSKKWPFIQKKPLKWLKMTQKSQKNLKNQKSGKDISLLFLWTCFVWIFRKIWTSCEILSVFLIIFWPFYIQILIFTSFFERVGLNFEQSQKINREILKSK